MVVRSNVNNVEFHIAEYQKIIAGLREEVFDLKRQLTECPEHPIADADDEQDLEPTQQVSAPQNKTAVVHAPPQDLGECTLRTQEAVRALEHGACLTPERGKRVLARWKLERENAKLELAEMQTLKHQITASFQERLQLRRMLVEIEDKNMQNKSDIEWREAQISAYENCRAEPRPVSGRPLSGRPVSAALSATEEDDEQFVMSSPKEEPSSIKNLRREIEVFSSNSNENMGLKVELVKRLKELSIEGQEHWAHIGEQVTSTERRELLELVVQTHTLELENMELELQLRLKDKMISDLQKEMEHLRTVIRRHGIEDDALADDLDLPKTARSDYMEQPSGAGEVQEELPLVKEEED